MTTLQTVDIGASPDDGTGDSVREAFEKINRNFDLLADALMARMSEQAGFAPMRHGHEDLVPRFVSDRAPAGAPIRLGAMWVNTVEGRIYLATGTEHEADWREIAFKG